MPWGQENDKREKKRNHLTNLPTTTPSRALARPALPAQAHNRGTQRLLRYRRNGPDHVRQGDHANPEKGRKDARRARVRAPEWPGLKFRGL